MYFDGKFSSTLYERQDHHVLVVDVVITTPYNRCTRSQPITRCKAWQPRARNAIDRFWTGCHVDAIWLPFGKIISAKTLKWHSNWGHSSAVLSPTCSRRHEYITCKYNSSWNSAPFFLKKNLGSPKLHFSNSFSGMKILEFLSKGHGILFPMVWLAIF